MEKKKRKKTLVIILIVAILGLGGCTFRDVFINAYQEINRPICYYGCPNSKRVSKLKSKKTILRRK